MSDWVHSVSRSKLAEYLYETAVQRDESLPEPVSSHMRRCVSCREKIARLKVAMCDAQSRDATRQVSENDPIVDLLDAHFRYLDVPITCTQARRFLPGLARFSADLRIPTPITVHVDHCPECAADLQALRELNLDSEELRAAQRLYEQESPGKEEIQTMPRVAYDIAERPDSGVTTVYNMIDEDLRVVATQGDPYAAYPIRVEVLRPSRRPALTHSRTALKDVACRLLTRRIVKPAAAVAAVLVLASLFHSTRGTSGIALGAVTRAFEQARNVRIVGFHPLFPEEVIYELLVSRDLNLVVLAREGNCTVYDLAQKEVEDVASQLVEPIGDTSLANVSRLEQGSLGFSLAGVPANAAWKRTNVDGNRDVYELTWTRQANAGNEVAVMYEVVVDRTTMLPASLRTFRWEPLDMEWECVSAAVFDYISETEMDRVLGRPMTAGTGQRL